MMARGGDVQTRLTRALEKLARGAGLALRWERLESCGWASATFAGERHRLVLATDDHPALAGWLEDLPGEEVAMQGHLLADLTVAGTVRDGGTARVTIEALTVAAD